MMTACAAAYYDDSMCSAYWATAVKHEPFKS